MSEVQFRRLVVKAFEKVGFMATVIEPNLGSTPGVPDLVLSKRDKDCWVELKVATKHLTEEQVWQKLLRPAQRQWIRGRVGVADGTALRLHVMVNTPIGIDLYSVAYIRRPIGLVLLTPGHHTLPEIVGLLNTRWS